MRILAISDIHGWLPDLGKSKADVLVIAGDLVPDGFNPDYKDLTTPGNKLYWLRNDFANWVEAAPVDHIIAIAGNHDFPIMKSPSVMRDLEEMIEGFHYLQDESLEIDGVVFHGSPWTPTFGHWAFMKDDPALAEEWDKIPSNVNVLVTHGPPFGILDKTAEQWGSVSVGCKSLRNKIDYNCYPDLKLQLFGHIHPAYGKQESADGSVVFANVSCVNDRYIVSNKPMYFEV